MHGQGGGVMRCTAAQVRNTLLPPPRPPCSGGPCEALCSDSARPAPTLSFPGPGLPAPPFPPDGYTDFLSASGRSLEPWSMVTRLPIPARPPPIAGI